MPLVLLRAPLSELAGARELELEGATVKETLEGDVEGGFEVGARAFPGQAVEYAMRDPRSGRYLASVTSWFYGGRIWVTDDPAGEWEEAGGVALPGDGDASLARIWVIQAGEADGMLYAGGDPGCLFQSENGGLTWELNRGLWDHPTRPDWTPGAGGLCLHTIVPWPGDPERLMVAISAVGVWLSDDRGASWRYSNSGIVPESLPEEARTCPLSTVSTTFAALPRAPSASSCSSTEGSTALTTRGQPGSTSGTTRRCRRTSASRSSSTRPTPTAHT